MNLSCFAKIKIGKISLKNMQAILSVLIFSCVKVLSLKIKTLVLVYTCNDTLADV